MDHLGRYEIIEQTGTGAMGNVYRARDTTLDREIALKTIRTGVDVAPEVRQRFYREARACARLQHPNIITVFDMGEVENTAYIAMEFLKGADFRRIIQERRPISVQEKLAACIDVCEAIAHAHRHGVIHRDIKPSNLYLTDEGRTKVLDFGIARLPSSRLTVAGQILGTPNYMAPEQILAQASDGRADLFSAAVVFFEFLTFAHPFQSSFIPRRIVQGEPDSLFDGEASLPVILEKVLCRGLAKNPDLRFQTGDEFAADLRTVLDALRGNASPSFSGVQLPSQQAVRPAPPRPPSEGTVWAPEGQDPEEWRLSEALRLLPEFEAAIDQRDLARAQTAVFDLESRLAGDIRFAEAIRLCHSRMRELDSATVAMPPPSMAGAQPTPSVDADAPTRLSVHGMPMGDAADAGSIDLDATFFGSSQSTAGGFQRAPELPSPSVPSDVMGPPTSTQEPVAPTPPSSKTPTINSKTPTIKKSNQKRTKILIMSGGAAVCAIIVLVAGVVALRPVPVESNVATAVVRVASASIFANPDRAAKRIGSLSNGTQVNVLRLPVSRDQEWINVQVVKPKILRPGYVRAPELGDWRGRTGAAALALVRALDAGDAGTEDEIRTRLQELNNLVSSFPTDPAAKEALLDSARSRLILVQRYRAAGRASEDWQSELRAAERELDQLSGDRDLQPRVFELKSRADQLVAEQLAKASPPQAASGPLPPPPDVSGLLALARQLRLDGDYPEAARVVERILRISPNNNEAKALRDKIRRGYDAEK